MTNETKATARPWWLDDVVRAINDRVMHVERGLPDDEEREGRADGIRAWGEASRDGLDALLARVALLEAAYVALCSVVNAADRNTVDLSPVMQRAIAKARAALAAEGQVTP